MAKWCTIAPIESLFMDKLETIESPIDLGRGIVLDTIPEWFKDFRNDEDLGVIGRNVIENANFCLFVEYEAESLGDPDPNWKGKRPRSKQDIAVDKFYYANLALWLAKPSGINFGLIIDSEERNAQWDYRRVMYPRRIMPLKAYWRELLGKDDFAAAKVFNEILVDIDDEGPLKIAANTLISALREDYWDLRYIILWIALEALFGPEDAQEITHRLAQRLAFFLNETKPEVISTYKDVKSCYKWRSKLVHGRRSAKLSDEEVDEILLQSESLIQKSLKRILVNSDFREVFNGQEREQYLDALVFNNLPEN